MKSIKLELSDQEARELLAALDLHLREEEREVVRTDNPEYRHGLVADFNVLEGIRRKLGALVDEPRSEIESSLAR